MRRSRFAGTVKIVERDQRTASVSKPCRSTCATPATSDDSSASPRSASPSSTYVPLLLGVAHLISSAADPAPSTASRIPVSAALVIGRADAARPGVRCRRCSPSCAFANVSSVAPRNVTTVMSLVRISLSSGCCGSLFGYRRGQPARHRANADILPSLIGTVIVASAVAVDQLAAAGGGLRVRRNVGAAALQRRSDAGRRHRDAVAGTGRLQRRPAPGP